MKTFVKLFIVVKRELRYSMNKSILAVLLVLLGWANMASADPALCQPGTVASLAGTSCVIGDKLFTFGTTLSIQDDSHLLTITPADILFAPDASNPNAPGFVLTGAITENSGSNQPLDGELDWSGSTVSTLSGNTTIAGLTASINATRVGQVCKDVTCSGPSNGSGFAIFNGFDLSDPTFLNHAFVFVGPVTSDPVCLISSTCTSNFPMNAAAVVFALAYGVVAFNGGMATITSASFFVNETSSSPPSSVPEPGTLLLLGSGLAGFCGLGRKRRFTKGKS